MIQGSRHVGVASATANEQGCSSPLPGSFAVTVTRAFPGCPDQISRVREFVRLVLGPVPVAEEAVLLASELATNAVLHTASGNGGTFEVAVRRTPSAVRIDVRDAGSHQAPVPVCRFIWSRKAVASAWSTSWLMDGAITETRTADQCSSNSTGSPLMTAPHLEAN